MGIRRDLLKRVNDAATTLETLKKDINQEWETNIKGKGAQKPKSPAGAYITKDPNENNPKGNDLSGCGHCRKRGHKEDKCWKKHGKPCFKCKKLGHLRADCPLNQGKVAEDRTEPESMSFVGMMITAKGI